MRTIFVLCYLIGVICYASGSPYFSSAKLHPHCLKIEPTPKLSIEWGMRLFAGVRFYIPFGNTKAIHHVSELVSGTKVSNNEDLKKMCMLVRIKGFKLQMQGYGDHFMIQDCSVIKKGANHCVVNEQSENPEVQQHGDGIFTIVWTNNEDSLAFVRCTLDGLYNDWYVFSSNVTLNDSTKSSVLSTMKKLGFQDTLEETVSPSYEGCELIEEPTEED